MSGGLSSTQPEDVSTYIVIKNIKCQQHYCNQWNNWMNWKSWKYRYIGTKPCNIWPTKEWMVRKDQHRNCTCSKQWHSEEESYLLQRTLCIILLWPKNYAVNFSITPKDSKKYMHKQCNIQRTVKLQLLNILFPLILPTPCG